MLDLRRHERTFRGRVSIDVESGGALDEVVLDSVELTIVSATIDGIAASVEHAADTIRLRAGGEAADRSTARIEIVFQGAMSRSTRGLCPGDGYAISQFQPDYARRVFPCFDTAGLKATFDVSVTADEHDVIVTNGGSAAPMPPYLLLIAAGPFREKCEGRIRLLSLDDPDRYSAALGAANTALESLESYLGIHCPWETLDLLAVPSFEADGMECSGAVVFRAGALLDSERAETLVTHEIAHQWFGSLVTPASWSDLWLSEGFATWIAAKATGTDVELVRAIRAAMATDSARSARPLRRETAHPIEMFDTTTYAKGAAILRMAESVAGEETFRRHIREFLLRYANANASTGDLHLPEWMAPFIDETGVPRLTFEARGNTIRIEGRHHSRPYAGPVFFRAGLEDGTTVLRTELLYGEVTEVAMPGGVRWVFGNANASGYYRCSYRHAGSIPVSNLTPSERAAFLADIYDAAWVAESDTLELLRAIEQMPDDAMAVEISSQIEELLAGRTNAPATPVERLQTTDGAERIAVCEQLLRHPATRRTAWVYLKAHWTELETDLLSFGGRGAIPALAAASDAELRNDIASFFAQHPPSGAELALQQTLEQIDARIRFREREQRKFHCRLAWLDAARPHATPQLRFAHSILGGVTSALHGALHTRHLFDQLGLAAPPSMHESSELRKAVGGLEQRFLRLFHGEALIDEAVMQLALRAREDLDAAAAMVEAAPIAIVAILASREAAVREHFLNGMIAFADLLEGDQHAAPYRASLAAVERDVMVSRMNVVRAHRGDVDDAMRGSLETAAVILPGLFRSQAVDLAAMDAAFRGDHSFDHATATWAAFGFTAEEAETWRRAGHQHPATARLAASRR